MEADRRREEMRVMQAAINNPLIVERIFKQAEFVDKKNLRLISRFWRDATLEEWRSKSAAIRIKFQTKSVNHYTAREWSYYTKNLFVETFERMMEGRQKTANTDWPAPFRIQEKPFRRVIISEGIFSLPPYGGRHLRRSVAYVEEELKLFKFLDKFGFPLKYIRMEHCEIVSDSYVEDMKWITMEACPGLKELSLAITIKEGGLSTDFQGESFNTPGPEESKLTKLEIDNFKGLNNSLRTGWAIKEEMILSPFPNLKFLKVDKCSYSSFSVGKMLCAALANGKYLELDHLEFSILIGDTMYQESIEFLNKHIELAQPSSFKKFKVQLEFENFFSVYRLASVDDPILDHFFIANGHLLTHLEIKLIKPTHREKPELATLLTGYHFSSLTHLTVVYEKKYIACWSDFLCPAGALYFDFSAFQGMPRLQVFNCFDPSGGKEGEFSMAYQNLPIELTELKEFNFNGYDKITVSSLRMILGWMQSVKKLALYLDEETFPVVFEMAPQLEQLILLGGSVGLTDAEIDSGVMWLGQVERERQEMDWRKKTEAKPTQQLCGKMSKKKAKEIAQKKKRKSERERRREEIEKEEKEWIEKQEKLEGLAWSFVSYRKNSRPQVQEQSEVLHFPPRRPQEKSFRKVVDDFTVFCKLREVIKTRNVRIFRTALVSGHRWENNIPGLKHKKLIEYKIGGVE